MELTAEQKEMLEGKHGKAVKKAMEILTALGEIYGAKKLIPVNSVQIAGVSYDNLGEAGLEFLSTMAEDGKVKVLTTLNPAGMDMENWEALGISKEFAENQGRVIDAFKKMGIIATCTCTPYFIGNLVRFGEHIAWAESSAVCFSNSVLGAKTNREGGPSALAAALTGFTPEYGYHLEENRQAKIAIDVKTEIKGTMNFGALGKVIGEKIGNKIAYIKGIKEASVEELKSFSASIATYGGTALYHIEGITPNKTDIPEESIEVTEEEIKKAIESMNTGEDADFVSIGCPHASIREIALVAKLLEGKKVTKEVWITTARPIKKIADQMGYTRTIEDSGVKFACDTCCVVAPIKGRFKVLCTDSAKGCFYGSGKNDFKTKIASIEGCIEEALK
ncbi:MAG: aconitase X catalytic domain-containing protein [Candidatus Aenigmarchaeota archaeon]|nr:aconitase X catalytic domain-containing protein [Candidatus Aenigmarchaeota archaeon]